MKVICIVLATFAVALNLPAADTNTNVLLKIGTADAASHYDREMIVTGKVAQVTIRPTATFLNFDKPYPNSPFSVVIFPRSLQAFGDVNVLRQKSIEVRGTIKKYNDKPEIVLEKTNQLTVFGLTNWPVPLKTYDTAKTNAPAATATNLPEIM